MRNYLFLFCIILVGFKSSSAQTGGKHTYKFLNLIPSARVSALGGNLIAVRDNDLQLVYHNPSLLDSNMHNHFALSYVNYFADINYGNIAYAQHRPGLGTFSGSLHYINYGKFIASEYTSDITGQFSAGEYSLNLSYVRPLDSSFSVGATLKTIYSSLESYSSVGSAVDIGATYYNALKAFTAAVLIKNAGFQYKAYVPGNRESLPFEIQAALSKKLTHAPVRFSLAAENLQKWNLRYRDTLKTSADSIDNQFLRKTVRLGGNLGRHLVVGAEFLFGKNFYLRAGFNVNRRTELRVSGRPALSGFSFGAGFKIYKFMFSYGRSAYHLAGASNHISVGLKLSDFYSKK